MVGVTHMDNMTEEEQHAWFGIRQSQELAHRTASNATRADHKLSARAAGGKKY